MDSEDQIRKLKSIKIYFIILLLNFLILFYKSSGNWFFQNLIFLIGLLPKELNASRRKMQKSLAIIRSILNAEYVINLFFIYLYFYNWFRFIINYFLN